MSSTSIEKTVAEILESFEDKDKNRFERFARAIERYKELERQGIIKSRGSVLMPIEDRYRLNTAYNKSEEITL